MPLTLDTLYARLDACMLRDRRRLHARLRGLEGRRGSGQDHARVLAEIEESIDLSSQRRERRQATLPKPTFPTDLPVSQKRDEIARAIRDHQVIVLCGETGSGKTTQLPKICLELGRGVDGLIGHTQPRRLAARTVAARIADELGSRIGTPGCPVGFKVRFGDETHPDNFIKLMTDGILLAETQGDRHLEQYDTLIIDEAHERSLNIDFLLGYLRQLLPRRRDLKVIVTSATIDPQRFAQHFAGPRGPAPVIEVSGRTYPVEVRYRPIELPIDAADDPDEDEPDMQDAILGAVDEVAREPAPPAGGPRDILIFLSGEREIRETAENLRKHHPPDTEILPLYARLSAEEQQRVFQPRAGRRRIVLATNVAETSLTVPGIRYVIDPGYARISRYSPRTKVQRLPIEKISQASANQRKGRCGRLSDGVCIRLYSQEDFAQRPEFTDPEIRRTNLASVILQMESLRLGHIDRFPFVEPPDQKMIRDGYDTLIELGAVTPDPEHPELHRPTDGTRLTKAGESLARLPVDPRIGRMILAAQAEDCLADMLIIAAALSVQDPRERPIERAEDADRAHAQFRDENSDFVGFLRLWHAFEEQSRKLTGSRVRKWCKDNFLSYVRLREWRDVHSQLKDLAGELGLKVGQRGSGLGIGPRGRGQQSDEPRRFAQVQVVSGSAASTPNPKPQPSSSAGPDPEALTAALHRALLTGLLSNLGVQNDPRNKYEYSGARGNKFHLFPGSALFRKSPKWVVAAELVKTTKLYARTLAVVHPSWIERAAPHLLKRTYCDPHWNERVAQVWAYERVTLFGLELFPRRHVHYGPIDPKLSRELFIHHALIEGQYWSNAPFARHNRELVGQVDSLQARLRRRDFMLDIAARFEFFDKRLPASIYSGQAFEPWLRGELKRDPRALRMTLDDLLVAGSGVSAADLRERYPDFIEVDGSRLPLEYRFEPGHAEDGITVVVPLATLGHLTDQRVDWLIPGMLTEKVTALMRTLPKDVRRTMVPAPEFAAKAVASMIFARGSLLESLAEALGRVAGTRIDPSQFDAAGIDTHLRMNIRIVDSPVSPPEPSPDRDAPPARGARAQREAPVAQEPSAQYTPPPPPKILATGRELRLLQTQFRSAIQASLAAEERSPWNREHVTDWDFGDLPEQVEVIRGGVAFPAYPAVIDPASQPGKPRMPRPNAVWLRLMDRKDVATQSTRLGLRRLFVLQTREELRFQVGNLSGIDKMLVHYGPIGDPKEFKEDLADLIAEQAFLAASSPGGEADIPRTKGRFQQRLDAGWHRLTEAAVRSGRVVAAILAARHALALRCPDAVAPLQAPLAGPDSWRESMRDIRLQMANLTPPGFVSGIPFDWLGHLPRYIQAVERRVHKLSSGGHQAVEKDRRLTEEVTPLWLECLRKAQVLRSEGRTDPGLVEFRWMIEEYRVSLFAQELGTSLPVSEKRLKARLEQLAE